MTPSLTGLHHVTAITADAQQNIDFYCGVLGMRLVKLTINFDDPGSYHLYYGDELGRPGSVMTFFAWPGAYRGRVGLPQVTTTSFSVPTASLAFWLDRLRDQRVRLDEPVRRQGDQVIAFEDPDGMPLEIVATARADTRQPWAKGGVPIEHGIRGFFGVTLSVEGYEKTAQLLTGVMGFRKTQEEGSRFRFEGGAGGPGTVVDVLCSPGGRPGTLGAGVVHHVAFATPGDAEQQAWQQAIAAAGHNVSPVMDRSYFHSIYFREPGGVLFEIATTNPGFTADEPPETLGTALKLPPWLEQARPQIEKALPKVRLPR